MARSRFFIHLFRNMEHDLNFCNKHQVHFEPDADCKYCTGRNKRGEWNMSKAYWPQEVKNDVLPSFKEGIKHDQSKPDLSLLPKEFLDEVALAFMHGEKKYGRYNYKNGLDWHRVISASMRHISAFNEGEDIDSESGLNHLSHAGACIAMLLVYYKGKIGKDTRWGK